ncbi:MAG: DNA mismatch repair endonuclease MutL [Kiritimatiellae bacterium]|nr:DNA mismatch repair endonuclease MutL [Kiritimatiellia bacterium]
MAAIRGSTFALMTTHVRLLPDEVTNKIAAGEVVDRPASVAKELMENALDAGATQIDLAVTAGGRKLVSVADNGSGMGRDDALLCVERHATSKIASADDIETIRTMGFRGEALAAISAVSLFSMKTCADDAVGGTELVIAGGKLQDVRELGWPRGTSVDVRNLFFNVPARRKFLRAAQTELAHVRQLFAVFAIGHPDVGFSLAVDGREACRLPGHATLEDRLCELFGADYPQSLRPVDFRQSDVRISGYVGLPNVSRTDRSEQYIFINRRPATAPLLMNAIKEGYRSVLPPDRHPCVFLFLEVPPPLVDVNVHPTKREVRFRRPGPMRDAVVEAIRRALSPAGSAPADAGPPVAGAGERATFRPVATNVSLDLLDLPALRAFHYPRMPMAPGAGAARPHAHPDAEAAPPAAPAGPWAWCRVLGQIGGLYVVLETEDGYVLMDPHAAHERVLFEKVMRDLPNDAAKSQGLLMPETVKVSPKAAQRLRKSLDVLRAMGFGVSEFGTDTFLVDALPAHLAFASGISVLLDVANALEQAGGRGASAEAIQEKVAQAACKAAVKARDKLTLQEIEQLVVDLANTEMPYTCPHGRPTIIFTSFRELNKKFGRE